MWDEESEAIHRFKLETVKSLSRLMKEPLKHLARKKNKKTCGFMCTNARTQLTHILPFSWIFCTPSTNDSFQVFIKFQ